MKTHSWKKFMHAYFTTFICVQVNWVLNPHLFIFRFFSTFSLVDLNLCMYAVHERESFEVYWIFGKWNIYGGRKPMLLCLFIYSPILLNSLKCNMVATPKKNELETFIWKLVKINHLNTWRSTECVHILRMHGRI